MPISTFNATAQIRPATITAALLVSSFNLPTAQLQDGALFIKRDGTVAMTASLNLGSNSITNLANGINPNDAVNYGQLTAVANGYGTKGGADTVSIVNVATLSGLAAVNGVTPVDGDVIMLPNQTTASQNGPWVAHAATWTRPVWYAGTAPGEGAYIVIERGTYAGYAFILATNTTTGPITVDTTATAWVTVPLASAPTAGNGITVTGTLIAVRNGNGISFDGATAVTLVLNGSSLNLSATGVKISDAAGPGQVMIGNGSNAATFSTFSGDVLSVSGTGAVALATVVRKTANFVYNETPGGVLNGTNTTFTLASTPVAGTVGVYYNGQKLYPGAGNDYTISSGTITTLFIPVAADRITADYQV